MVGALINRTWVASSFWQNVLSASIGTENLAGGGRSVKFSLEQEYCDRLAGDIAMADTSVIDGCNDMPTLNLAQ